MRRVFFALWPDEATVEHLAALAQELAGGNKGRLMPPQNLHLTLAFVGSVSDAQVQQLERIGAEMKASAFDVDLDRLGFWPQRGILWAGCKQPVEALRTLMIDLRTRLAAEGFAVETSASSIVPHVTLARGTRCAALPRLASPLRMAANEFTLVESQRGSQGSRYEIIASFPLLQAD